MTYSYTTSETFTLTHATHLTAKVMVDLRQLQTFYGAPSDVRMAQYHDELITLLMGGYLKSITYGFKKDDKWVAGATLQYTVYTNGALGDDSPGRIYANASLTGSHWSSFLEKNSKFFSLSSSERERIEKSLPIKRVNGEVSQADGAWVIEKSYTSGGQSMERKILKPFAS